MNYEEYKRKYQNKETKEEKGNTSKGGYYDRYKEKYGGSKSNTFSSNAQTMLESFRKDYEGFSVSAQESSKNMGYSTAESAWKTHYTTAEKLKTRASDLKLYLSANKELLDEDEYNGVMDYLNNAGNSLTNSSSYFSSNRRFYSQWESEDDYKTWDKAQKDREQKLSADTTALNKELDDLSAYYDDIANLEYQVGFLKHNPDEFTQEERDSIMSKYTELKKNYGSVEGLEKAIREKELYLSDAKRLQEGVRLASVSGNADFKDYSGYVSTESDSLWDNLTSQYGMGYDDLTYEYINNKNGIRSEIELKHDTYNRGGDGESTFEERGYDHLNENEIAIYNYYYAKEGKKAAQKYLDSIQETLNQRKAGVMYENMEDNTLLELAFGIVAGLDQFESGAKGAWNAITGNDEYIPATATQMASAMVREDLADETLPVWYNFKKGQWENQVFGSSVGQTAYDAITTTANMAPSIMTSWALSMVNPVAGSAWVTAGQIAGTSMMGASAAGNAYQEVINLGYDKEQARAYAALVGGSEAGLQYLLGGIGKLGGKLSGNALTKVLNGVDNAFARTALKLGGNMLSEGIEEGLQEVLTPWFQNLVLHTDNEVDWNEVAYSSLLGALTAGFMEGTSTIAGEVKTYKTGKNLQASDISAQRLSELGKTFSADTVAYQLAGRVNENTGAYTLGRLFNEIGATLSEQNISEITNALVSKGMGEEIAMKNAKALAYVVEGGQLSERQIAAIEANDVLAEVARTTLIDANTTWNQRSKGYNEMLKALSNEMTSQNASRTKQAQQGVENAPAADTVDGKNENGTESLSEAESVDTSPAKVKNFSALKNGQATIKLEDGSEVGVKDADLSPEDGVRIETIASIEGISVSDANFILNTLRDSTNASAQMDAVGAKEVFKYGFYGFSQEHLAKYGVFSKALTESQRQAIYEAGKNARQKQVDKATPKTATSKQRGVYFDYGGGDVVAFKDADKSLISEKKRSAGVQTAVILNKLGIGGDIYFFESYRNSKGKLVYKNSNGVEVKAPNGWYSETDGSIHIDLNAGARGNGLVLFTLAHELTHFIEQWSPKKFKVLADFLTENYQKGQSMDILVRAKQKTLSENRGKKVSYSEAYSEVIADSMEAMLADGNVMEKLMELKAKDNGLVMKMKQFFDNLLTKIRNAYKGLTPDSDEGKAVLEMTDSIEKIQQLFAEALVEASENYQAAMENVVEANAEAVSSDEIITDGAVVTDGEGTKFSIKSMKHDIAEGQMFEDLKTYCGWTQKQVNELRQNLENLVAYMTPYRDILDMNETYDREGRRFSPYKPNSDPLYKISMDFSTLCSKRLLTQYVIENLQLRENRPMSAEEQMAIRDMLNEYRKVEKGLQVACAMCYVEAARLKSPKQIQRWLNDPAPLLRDYFGKKNKEFNDSVKEAQADFKESRGYARNAPKKDMKPADVKELNKIGPKLRSKYQLSAEEQAIVDKAKTLPNSVYLTAGNLSDLSETDPVIYDAYTAFVRTATRSKSLETDEPYYYGDSRRDNGNGIVVSDSFIEAVNRENGMRFSSWSDWRIQHLLDYITAVIDNSVRGAAMHGYTKFGEEVRVLGKTGMMFNMSGVAGTQTGLNEDGSLSFSATESIDVNEAIQLREEFPEHAGLQCIGVGDSHIIELLKSDIIDYVIPYHVSGLNAALRRMADIYGWADYTGTQNAVIDKSIKKENAVDPEHWHEEPVYSEFFVGYDTGMSGIEAMRASAERYKQMCKDRGLTPKFNQFANEANYWKLLIDRKMINQQTGELIRQKAVTPTFDFDTIKAVVDRYVDNYDSGLEARALNHIVENWDSIPKRIKDLKKQGGTKAKKTKKAVDTLANETLAAQPTTKLSDRDIRQDPLYPDTGREQSAFNRSYMNQISDLKRNKERDIIINTHLYTYHVRAVGGTYKGNPFLGEILKKIPIDNAVTEHDVQEEVINGTYRATEEDYIPYEETQYDRSRNDGRTPSLRERLAAEGNDYLLDEPYEGDSEGGRGQGSGDWQSGAKHSDRVTDKDTLAFLNEQLRNGEVTEVYRAMAVGEDENLYPPMAGYVRKNGKKVINGHPSVIGEWEQSTESIPWDSVDEEFLVANGFKHFEKPTKDYPNGRFERDNTIFYRNKDGEWKAKFHLDKDNGATVDAAYAPYIHTSLSVLNDQFTSAYTRENLVVVKGYVPNSEVYGVNGKRYHANFADKPVGKTSWHSGVVAAQMPETRTVILSRYFMPIEIVDDAVVAQKTKEMMKGKDIEIPFNVVTPRQRRAMEAIGITIGEARGLKDPPKKADVKYSDRILMGSLFSGGGTLEAGLAYQMLDKQFGVEYDGRIASVYADNHGDHIQVGKVEDFDISKYDDIFYLHASPVCHNFSKAKHGAKELQMDIDSAKATAKHLETAMPQVFTVENAPGYRKSESLKIITDKLTELGYKWDVDVYNSADYGSATSRNRVILRAVKDGELPAKPAKQERTNSWDKVTRDLWGTLPKATLRPSFISAIENTRNLPILDANGKVNVNKPLLILTTTSGHMVTYCWEGDICPTLTTKCGEARLVMPDGNIYAVTPEFMGRIQGLPNDYKYPKEKTRAFTIIGNGIPTHLTKAVVGGVLDSAYEQTHEGKVLYQDRTDNSVSNRSLLANAFEGIAKPEEKQKVQEYKDKVALANAEEKKLRELNEQIKELSFTKGPRDTKKIRDLQFEARQTANRISTYDKILLRLEASKPLQDVLAREKKKAYQKAEQRGKEALASYKEKTAKTQRELLERWQDSRKKAIEGRNKTAMRHKIKAVVNELNQYLLKGTKDRHVPESLQKAVAEALDAVNMDTVGAEERIAKLKAELLKAKTPEQIQEISRKIDHIQEMGDKMNGRLKKLKDAYDELLKSPDENTRNSYDEVIHNKLDSVIDKIGNTPLRDMTLAQLEDVYDMYRMVLKAIRDVNKSFKDAKNQSISTRANAVMAQVEEVGGKHTESPTILNGIKKFFWNNLKPVYAFEHIGSVTLTEAFRNVRAGEDTWALDIVEARNYYLEKTKQYKYDSWDFQKQYKFTSTSDMEFSLNLEQILSLYAYSKRDQAGDHLKYGGIVFDESTKIIKKTKLGISLEFNPTDATAYNISEETLADITGKLTDEQKAFADEMQDYLSTVMGAKGNEVSMAMYDIKLFKDKNYFPLKSAQQFMEKARDQQKGEVKIKNSGFSKETVPKAKNPIVLTPFMEVWANHVNEMSMYHAFVLPLEDFYRIYNYKTPSNDANLATEGVNQYIQNAYGRGATAYIDQLLKDMNGGAITDSTTGFINKMMGLFKKGSVFASLSVVVQQPSAIARATALVDTKYFIGPKVDHKRHKALWDEVKRYAPVAIIKEMGYFDTNMGKSTQDYILSKEYSGFSEKMKALVTDSGYRDEILSKAPALADEIAWCSIWEAVKREVSAKIPGMDVKSDEFLKLAGERFTEVITKTQVYDSVLSRSGMMRSKDTGMKMATAFMAEPTTSINMIADALLQGKRGRKKYARAAIGAVIASQILNSILVSFVYAGRDDDEDETYLEKYIGTFTAEMLDGLNPATYIPFIKDIVSIVQGYDVERSDMAVVSDLWNAWQNLSKDNVSVYRKVEGFAGSIAQIFGLPVKNIMRDARGIYQTIDSFVNGQQTTAAGIGYAVKGAITGKDVSDSQQLYEAYLSGDKTQLARVKARFKDQNAINNAIRKGLRENDSRIREAAIAWNANDLDKYMRIAKKIIAEKHFAQDDVVMAIRSEANALAPDAESETKSKAKGLFTAEKFAEAIAQGDQAMANAIKVDIIQTAEKNGKSEEEAVKSFVSSATAACKELFLTGDISERQAVNALETYCDKTEDEAMADVQYWAFKQDNPDVYADDQWFDTYYEKIADSGLDIDVYMEYRNKVSAITGDGKKERRMAVINSLPITKAQKDALYYAEGWTKSKLYEAPWH